MAAEWFYTTNKQQMGPVSWEELRELASNGILKPNDMIWSEGMEEWIKAVKQRGLFGEDGDEDDDDTPRSKKSSLAKPPKNRRSTREADEDDDEEDERESRRKRRRQEENSAKTKVGLKVGLIIGGVVCFLLFLMCAGGAIVVFSLGVGGGGGGGPPGKRVHTFSEFNIPEKRIANPRQFHFKQGTRLIITSRNQTQRPDTDVDLLIYQGNEPNPRWVDVRLPNQDRNCRVEFVIPVTGMYRVGVHNLGPGTATRCDVRIEEH